MTGISDLPERIDCDTEGRTVSQVDQLDLVLLHDLASAVPAELFSDKQCPSVTPDSTGKPGYKRNTVLREQNFTGKIRPF